MIFDKPLQSFFSQHLLFLESQTSKFGNVFYDSKLVGHKKMNLKMLSWAVGSFHGCFSLLFDSSYTNT